jgi:hypothetical protein
MRVLDQYVLVEQIMVKKDSMIILDKAKNESEKFNFTHKVIAKGSECKRDIRIGDEPIFTKYAPQNFVLARVIEKTDTRMVNHIIVHENDIIAIHDPETDQQN